MHAGSKNIEIAVMERDSGLKLLTDEEVDALVKEVEEDKASSDAARRGQASGSGPTSMQT